MRAIVLLEYIGTPGAIAISARTRTGPPGWAAHQGGSSVARAHDGEVAGQLARLLAMLPTIRASRVPVNAAESPDGFSTSWTMSLFSSVMNIPTLVADERAGVYRPPD
jgi:hypothetical protein